MKYLKKISLSMLLVPISLFLLGCDQENVEPNIDFSFRLTDLNGVEKYSFSEGENFVLSFSIINSSSTELRLEQSSINQSNFLRVKKIIDSTEGSNLIDMGKPYEIMFCNKINGISIPKNDSLKIEIPWNPEMPWEPGAFLYSSNFCKVIEGETLTQGKYLTEFTTDFEIISANNTISISNKSFKIEFDITK